MTLPAEQQNAVFSDENIDNEIVDTEVVEKMCAGCRQAKPLTGFHRDHTQADGHMYLCKVCMRPDINAGHRRRQPRGDR